MTTSFHGDCNDHLLWCHSCFLRYRHRAGDGGQVHWTVYILQNRFPLRWRFSLLLRACVAFVAVEPLKRLTVSPSAPIPGAVLAIDRAAIVPNAGGFGGFMWGTIGQLIAVGIPLPAAPSDPDYSPALSRCSLTPPSACSLTTSAAAGVRRWCTCLAMY